MKKLACKSQATYFGSSVSSKIEATRRVKLSEGIPEE